MEPLRFVRWLLVMVLIMQVSSQRPTEPIPAPADGDPDNRHLDFGSPARALLNPLQRAKQKPITATGREAAPDEITFDTYNSALPALLRLLRRQAPNLFRTLQQRLQHQRQPPPERRQPAMTRPRPRTGSRWGESQAPEPEPEADGPTEPRPIKAGGNGFADMLYPEVDENAVASRRTDDDDDDDFDTRSRATLYRPDPVVRGPWAGSGLAYQRSLDEGWNAFAPPVERSAQALPWKRNAFRNYKRQKSRPQQAPFLPSISAGAMTNLGHFFKDLKNNLHFMENRHLSPPEQKLLKGDHPISLLHDELTRSGGDDGDGSPASGTAAFLHAIRTYRPSQKIRSLVSMNPEGYHGSQFLDPNYMWVGLGK